MFFPTTEEAMILLGDEVLLQDEDNVLLKNDFHSIDMRKKLLAGNDSS